MYDVKCPYCGTEQDINHDDGYGYEEDCDHDQGCTDCNKTFKFTTSISYNYDVSCQDNDHVMEPAGEKWPTLYECKNCDFYESHE